MNGAGKTGQNTKYPLMLENDIRGFAYARENTRTAEQWNCRSYQYVNAERDK